MLSFDFVQFHGVSSWGVEGATGRKMLARCDLRRVQALREADHEKELAAVPFPPDLHYTLADELRLRDHDAWRKLQQVIGRVSNKSSGRFQKNNDYFVRGLAALGRAKAELARGLLLFHKRDLTALAGLLAACGSLPEVRSHEEALAKFKASRPSAQDIGLTTLCAENDKEIAEYEVALSTSIQELDSLFAIVRDAFDESILIGPFIKDVLPKFQKLFEKWSSHAGFEDIKGVVAEKALRKVVSAMQKTLLPRFVSHYKQIWMGTLPKFGPSFAKFKVDEPIANADCTVDFIEFLVPLDDLLHSCKSLTYQYEGFSFEVHTVALAFRVFDLIAAMAKFPTVDGKLQALVNFRANTASLTAQMSSWRSKAFLGDVINLRGENISKAFREYFDEKQTSLLKTAKANLATLTGTVTESIADENIKKFVDAASDDGCTQDGLEVLAPLIFDDQCAAIKAFGEAHFALLDCDLQCKNICETLGAEFSASSVAENSAVVFAILSSLQVLLQPLEGPKAHSRSNLVMELSKLCDLSVLPKGIAEVLRTACPNCPGLKALSSAPAVPIACATESEAKDFVSSLKDKFPLVQPESPSKGG